MQSGIVLNQLHVYAILMTAVSCSVFLFESQTAICMMQRFLASFCHVLLLATVLTRLTVLLSLRSRQPLNSIFQALIVILLIVIQAVINVQWLIHEPSSENVCTPVLMAWIQNHGFSMLILVLCTVIALSTMNNPYNYRETAAIALYCGLSIPVTLAWNLVGLLLKHEAAIQISQGYGLASAAWLSFLTLMAPADRRAMADGTGAGLHQQDATMLAAEAKKMNISTPSVNKLISGINGSIAQKLSKQAGMVKDTPPFTGQPVPQATIKSLDIQIPKPKKQYQPFKTKPVVPKITFMKGLPTARRALSEESGSGMTLDIPTMPQRSRIHDLDYGA